MSNVKNVYDYIDALAPFKSAEEWDNSGLLIGSPTTKVERALIALDVTDEVIDEAIELKATLIITHHPVIFKPFKNIEESDLIYRLIANNIAVISAHTNLDIAKSGVNFTLADVLELSNISTFEPVGDNLSLGRIGKLKRDYTPLEFARQVKTNLKCLGLRYVDGGKPIRTVAVCGGSGGELFISAMQKGADCLVTGDVKHHIFLEAKRLGFTIIDAGHFYTENVIINKLAELVSAKFSDIEVFASDVSRAPEEYI